MGMEPIYIQMFSMYKAKIDGILAQCFSSDRRGDTNCFTRNSLRRQKEVSALSSSRLTLVRTVLGMSKPAFVRQSSSICKILYPNMYSSSSEALWQELLHWYHPKGHSLEPTT